LDIQSITVSQTKQKYKLNSSKQWLVSLTTMPKIWQVSNSCKFKPLKN
jgi:hypothetical protein